MGRIEKQKPTSPHLQPDQNKNSTKAEGPLGI